MLIVYKNTILPLDLLSKPLETISFSPSTPLGEKSALNFHFQINYNFMYDTDYYKFLQHFNNYFKKQTNK